MIQPLGDFTRRIQGLTGTFVGREWLLRAVDDFLRQEEEHYLTIIGEPGIGKSTFAAHLTQVRPIHAYHFCVARQGGTLDPIFFVRSLSHQLARTLPDFNRSLVRQQSIHQYDIVQNIGVVHDSGSVYGLYIDQLIVQTKSADEAFQTLVREPLQGWAAGRPSQERIVLLVDALDEAILLDRGPNIADLIGSARDLPNQVRWILTSRPGEHLTSLPAMPLVVEDNSDNNIADVRTYITTVLTEPIVAGALQEAGKNASVLSDELVQLSGGNFLYLFHVLHSLQENATAGRSIVSPNRLPLGLDGVYREFMDRSLVDKAKDEWHKIYRPVLGILVVAQEALDFESLSILSGMRPQDVNDVLNDLAQFFNIMTEGKSTKYRIYHASFSDFLLDRNRNQKYWINRVHYHRQVADYYHEAHRDNWFACNLYGLRYLPIHLIEAGQKDKLCTLLTNSPAWMQAKSIAFMGDGSYADDLKLAMKDFADPLIAEEVQALTQLYAARQVVTARVNVYEDADLEALTWLGREHEALNHARLRWNVIRRFTGMLTVYETLRKKGKPQTHLWKELLVAARNIGDVEEQVMAFCRLLVSLSEAEQQIEVQMVYQEAAKRARTARESTGQEWAMMNLAGALAQVQRFTEALEVARAIENLRVQCEALGMLAPALALDDRKAEVIIIYEEIFKYIRDHKDELIRAIWLRRLALALVHVGYLPEALEVTNLIDIKEPILEDLALKLAYSGQFPPALEVARTIDNKELQASTLSRIALKLAKANRQSEAYSTLREALEIGRGIADSSDRAAALSEIALFMAAAGFQVEAHDICTEVESIPSSLPEGHYRHDMVKSYLSEAWALVGDIARASEAIRSIRELQVAENAVTGLIRLEAFTESLRLAQAIPNESYKSKVLHSVVGGLVRSGYFEEAKGVALAIEDSVMRAEALIMLAASMEEHGLQEEAADLFKEAFQEVIKVLPTFGRGWYRSSTVRRITVSFARAGYEVEADTLLREIKVNSQDDQDGTRQAQALCALARGLWQAKQEANANVLFTKAREAAFAVEREQDRLSVLRTLAENLLQCKYISEALEVAKYLDDYGIVQLLHSLIASQVQSRSFSIALEAVRAMKDSEKKAGSLCDLAITFYQTGLFEDTTLVLTEAEEIIYTIEKSWVKARMLNRLAMVLKQTGNEQRSFLILIKAWHKVKECGNPMVHELLDIVKALAELGHFTEAREVIDDIELARYRVQAILNLALVRVGNEQEVTVLFAEAEREARSIEEKTLQAYALCDLGRALAKAERKEDAERYFVEAEEIARKAEDTSAKARLLLYLGLARNEAGEKKRARLNMIEAGMKALGIENIRARLYILRDVASILERTGHQREVGLLLAKVVNFAVEVDHDSQSDLVRIAENLARLERFTEAVEIARSVKNNMDQAWAFLNIAVTLGQTGKKTEAGKIFEETKYAALAISDRENQLWVLWNLSAALAKAGFFVEALAALGPSSPNKVIHALAEWMPAFEEVKSGLSVAVLQEAMRIIGWLSSEWQSIHSLLFTVGDEE